MIMSAMLKESSVNLVDLCHCRSGVIRSKAKTSSQDEHFHTNGVSVFSMNATAIRVGMPQG